MELKQHLLDEWNWFVTARGKAARLDPSLCRGCWTCIEVCPIGCFRPDPQRSVVQLERADHCVACGACVLQCPEGALSMSGNR